MKKLFISGMLVLSAAAFCATTTVHQTTIYNSAVVRDTIPPRTSGDTMYNKNKNMQHQNNSQKPDTTGTWKRTDSTMNNNNNTGTKDSTHTPQ